MESVRAGCDMLHYFVLILLLECLPASLGIRLSLGLAGKWRKSMDLRF